MERSIYLAGGCFWGVESYFKNIKGVVKTSVGYANGTTKTTSYKQLSESQHAETVEIIYTPEIVGLSFLLSMYFKIINPTSVNHQGGDHGIQYRTGIYYVDELDLPIIRKSLHELSNKISGTVAIEVEPLSHYCLAEDMHQHYLDNHPGGYCHIQPATISDALTCEPVPEPAWRLASFQKSLTPLQYQVTQHEATEPPYQNEYWDFYEDGIYLDVITGEPLFSSKDKFACNGGWASFSKPLSQDSVMETSDESHNMSRTEVKSHLGHTHLGHVFTDGPKDSTGLRYCINSASLYFVPVSELEQNGFGQFLPIFYS
ncbi:MAG: peptide-methionine (R)-S-oxide reductase MsrB [Lachnospiraceae bacterium]